MPYVLPDHKLAFFFSPKSGGTSLRAFLFHIENGFPFRDHTVQGERYDANSLAENRRFNWFDHKKTEGFEYIALVRDPIRRFLSGYSNRVQFYGELSEANAGSLLAEHGLAANPEIDEFVRDFDGYRKCSKSVARHFLPQQKFVGKDQSVYCRIFKLEEVEKLVDYTNERTGSSATMPCLQTGGRKLNFSELSAETQSGIVELCKNDIAFDFCPEYKEIYLSLLE